MRLETEFRVRLQIMQLEQAFESASALHPQAVSAGLSANTWVKLVQPPTAFSDDEALLLCLDADDRWLAWIPGYGEIVLDLDEFYELP